MRKSIPGICILLLSSVAALAGQRKGQGKITDDQGMPSANCEIRAARSIDAVFSNTHGEFTPEREQNLPPTRC